MPPAFFILTNLSYPVIPCRTADTKLPAAVRYGDKTVFLFLSEFFKPFMYYFPFPCFRDKTTATVDGITTPIARRI